MGNDDKKRQGRKIVCGNARRLLWNDYDGWTGTVWRGRKKGKQEEDKV